jgi:hypothetical protein
MLFRKLLLGLRGYAAEKKRRHNRKNGWSLPVKQSFTARRAASRKKHHGYSQYVAPRQRIKDD